MKIEASTRLMRTAEAYWEYVNRLAKDPRIKQIGEGANSRVFQHPTLKNVVVKLVLHDEEYLKFARFAMDNRKNPWLPRITDIKIVEFRGLFMASNSYFVFMEKLKPAPFKLQKDLVTDLARTYGLKLGSDSSHTWFTKPGRARLAVKSKDPGMAQFATFAAKNFDHLDLHQQNIMKRGQQIVFVDPFR